MNADRYSFASLEVTHSIHKIQVKFDVKGDKAEKMCRKMKANVSSKDDDECVCYQNEIVCTFRRVRLDVQ